MGRPNESKRETEVVGAVSQATAAKVLGFKSSGSLRAMADAPRLDSGKYDLRELVPWYVARQVQASESESLLDGPESPGLERYRLAKAALAELELGERTHKLIDVETARGIMLRWGAALKRYSERLRKRLPGEHRSFAEALKQCQRIVDELRAAD
jgi:hypothetical protein